MKLIKYLLIILFFLVSCYIIYNKEYKTTTINTSIITKIGTNIQKYKYKEDKIGELIIEKIHLKENLYKQESYLNNVDRNIAILKNSESPKEQNSIMIIAAHSGTGSKAYFENLNKININDSVILEYENSTYTYIVKDIWSEEKTGKIKIPKENTNQLILTTCHPTKKNYQLIVNCTKKE